MTRNYKKKRNKNTSTSNTSTTNDTEPEQNCSNSPVTEHEKQPCKQKPRVRTVDTTVGKGVAQVEPNASNTSPCVFAFLLPYKLACMLFFPPVQPLCSAHPLKMLGRRCHHDSDRDQAYCPTATGQTNPFAGMGSSKADTTVRKKHGKHTSLLYQGIKLSLCLLMHRHTIW